MLFAVVLFNKGCKFLFSSPLAFSTPLLGTTVPRCLPYIAGATQRRSEDSLNSSFSLVFK